MERILRHLFFAFLTTCSLLAGAAEPRRTEELMEKSGLNKQLGDLQDQIKKGARESQQQGLAAGRKPPQTLSPEDFQLLMGAMDRAYAPAKLRATMKGEIERILSADDERAALTWLSSDVGRKFTRLEVEANAGDQQKKAQETEELFPKVPGARVAKLQRLADSMAFADATASLMINMAAGIAFGMALATPGVEPETLAKMLKDKLEPQRPAMVQFMNEQGVKSFAYTYRSVSDAELEQYVGFAESPAGRRYHQATIKAMDAAFARASIEMGRQFGLMRKEKTTSS